MPVAIEAAFTAPVFTDVCDASPAIVVTNAHTGSGCIQSDKRTWTATDACGNSAAVDQVITYTVDHTAPAVTTAEGADNNIGCNPLPVAIEAAFTAPVFTDVCDASPVVVVTTAHTGAGCLQSDKRTWTATDACGNSAAVDQVITYTVDHTAPAVTTPEGADNNIGCNPLSTAIEAAFTAPVFTDVCDASPVVVVTTAHTLSLIHI